MSSHRRRVKHFSRASGPRKALLRGLMGSLIEHGRITTTVDRAKEVRRHVEKAITLGKKGDLSTRRLLLSKLGNNLSAVKSLMEDISKRFEERPGGYTRVIKIGRRPGDTAEMAFLEFVDYDFNTAKVSNTDEQKDEKSVKKQATKAKKAATALVASKKKTANKKQKKARVSAR